MEFWDSGHQIGQTLGVMANFPDSVGNASYEKLTASMDYVFPIVGILLCALIVFQIALWSAGSIQRMAQERRVFRARMDMLRRQIDSKFQNQTSRPNEWQGFRKFVVRRLVRESKSVTSVYLEPEDGNPLPSFRPGQFLTIQFKIPGQAKPFVRCYSLSDRPDPNFYRITVKRDVSNGNGKPGRVSNFVNDILKVGDVLDIKSPGGSFCIDLNDRRPAILLAGGVGITPMISMIKSVTHQNANRQLLLMYGVRDGSDHPFRDELNGLQEANTKLSVLSCYSNPRSEDRLPQDYHYRGRISIDLIRHVIPRNDVPFYLCGPPAFVQSLHQGLREWGVSEADLHTESFGPASIEKAPPTPSKHETACKIRLTESETVIDWEDRYNSILEATDDHDIEMNSGCRAGNCGECAVKMTKGDIRYSEQPTAECDPQYIFPCLAVPNSDLEIEA